MSYSIIIFGASGDLTSRKLVPALYRLHRKKRLPQGTNIVGFSRTAFSHDEFRAKLAETTAQFTGGDFDPAVWSAFAERIYYHPGDLGRAGDFVALASFLDDLDNSDVQGGATPRASTIWRPRRSSTNRPSPNWARPDWPMRRRARAGWSSKSRSAPTCPPPAS